MILSLMMNYQNQYEQFKTEKSFFFTKIKTNQYYIGFFEFKFEQHEYYKCNRKFEKANVGYFIIIKDHKINYTNN